MTDADAEGPVAEVHERGKACCPAGATAVAEGSSSNKEHEARAFLRLDADRLMRQCQEDASRLMARRLRQQQLRQDQPTSPMTLGVVAHCTFDNRTEVAVPRSVEIASHNADSGDVSVASSIAGENAESVLSDDPSLAFGQEDIEDPALEEGAKGYAPAARIVENRYLTVHIDPNEDTPQFSNGAASDSDFSRYALQVNPDQQDRAIDIPLYSFARPHMRAFHMSWMSFFVAFFLWFSITPLLSEIAYTLHLTHEEVWTSTCLAVASSAVTRILIGPLNDKYGARWIMSLTLVFAAIPSTLAGWIIRDATSLYFVRFFIGVAGSAFVTSQFWTSSLFCVEIAGTANALVAGWGNLGGGVAQVVMGSVLFPIFKLIYGGSGFGHKQETLDYSSLEVVQNSTQGSPEFDSANARASELAWRTVLVFPALAAFVMAWVVVRFSDDSPKGNVYKRRDVLPAVNWSDNLLSGLKRRNTLLLFLQYGCCFGLEITMTQAAALYFKSEYGQSTESAAGIASIIGWMNLFARGMGGFFSDMANAKSGMRGRLWCQALFLASAGLLVILFSFTCTLAGAIVVLIFCSVVVAFAEGSTFGIVPYVMPEKTGSIIGWVGSGGNVGGVAFSLLFRSSNYRSGFLWMGSVVILGSLLTTLLVIPGHRGLLHGRDSPQVYEHRRRAKLPDSVSLPPVTSEAVLECSSFCEEAAPQRLR